MSDWRFIGRLEDVNLAEFGILLSKIRFAMGVEVIIGDTLALSSTEQPSAMRAGGVWVTDIWAGDSIRISAPLRSIQTAFPDDYLFAMTPDDSLESRLARIEAALGLPRWRGTRI